MKDDRTPLVVVVWVAGLVLIWLAAKIYFFVSWDRPHYFARHWPFWVAMAVWSVAVIALAWFMERHKKKHQSQ